MSGLEATTQPLSFQDKYDIGIDFDTNEGSNIYEKDEMKIHQNNGSQIDRWAELEDEAFEYYDNNNNYGINETQGLKQVNI